MIQYFWEYNEKFANFLRTKFPNTYKQKFSMVGNGIYNLILIGDKVYEVKFSQTTNMLENNNKMTTDIVKNKIINHICQNLKNNYSLNNGKITFKLNNWIAKVEVIKKTKMPE